MNRTFLKLIFGVVSAFCLATTSLAYHTTNLTGSYVGAKLGMGGMDTPKPDKDTISVSYDYHFRRNLSLGCLVGYLWSDDSSFYYGLELEYLQYPSNDYIFHNVYSAAKLQYKGNSLNALIVGKYYFNDRWNVLGKIGAARIRQTLTGSSNGFTAREEEIRKWYPELSLGLGFDFNRHVGIDLTFTHIKGDRPLAFFTADSYEKYERVASVNLLMLSINYRFI